MIGVISLALVSLALLAALVYREWAHDRERRALLDRIQAPQASVVAALDRAVGPRGFQAPPDPYDQPVTLDDDLQLDGLMEVP